MERWGDNLRFISPIRNPYDQARSLQAFYERAQRVPDVLGDLRLEAVARAIFHGHTCFLEAWREKPERFFYFNERQLGSDLLFRLARFLNLEPDGDWLRIASGLFKSTSRYLDRPDEVRVMIEVLRSDFAHVPWFVELMREALTG